MDAHAPEIAEFARNLAVMVRIQGPDPKGLKMQKHAFHHYHSGKTTLSASGMLVPDSLKNASCSEKSGLVVTVASVVEPFLSVQHREKPGQGVPELIPGAQIDVMVENKMKEGDNVGGIDKGTLKWLSAQLVALFTVPASSLALQSLVEAPTGSPEHGPWEIGWSLAPFAHGPHGYVDAAKSEVGPFKFLIENDRHFTRNVASNQSHMAKPTVRVALLRIPSMNSEDVQDVFTSQANKRGNLILAMGSPFGILSPVHFFNSVSVGAISNCYPSSSDNSSLLMSDIRCLPGTEGGPVFAEGSQLVGILHRPLKQKAGGVEIQLVIPWEAIVTARGDLLQNGKQKAGEVMYRKENLHSIGKGCSSDNTESIRTFNYVSMNQDSYSTKVSQIAKAMASIALLNDENGSWASGVLLNKHGLILTNAHLMEPWRFGKTSVQGEVDGTASESLPINSFKSIAARHERSYGQKDINGLSPEAKVPGTSLGDEERIYKLGPVHKSYKRIRARLDHLNPSVWCDAKVVYLSKGPLDIALLQLEFIPKHLCHIIPDFTCPSPGSKAYVIGHGLFGPRSDLYPSVWSGVVSKVVRSSTHLFPSETGSKAIKTRHLPAMVETSAAVHPGASGGAVVNSDGHMIGLVTSNSRHGGGTQIPYLNFSIPSAALQPIFRFAGDMQDLSILESLEKPQGDISAIWAFQLESYSEDRNSSRKGSRFAKFIAEKHVEIFPRLNELPKVGKLGETRSSKL